MKSIFIYFTIAAATGVFCTYKNSQETRTLSEQDDDEFATMVFSLAWPLFWAWVVGVAFARAARNILGFFFSPTSHRGKRQKR